MELDPAAVPRGHLIRPGKGRIRGVRSIDPSKCASHTLRKERELLPAALGWVATRNIGEPRIGLEGINKTMAPGFPPVSRYTRPQMIASFGDGSTELWGPEKRAKSMSGSRNVLSKREERPRDGGATAACDAFIFLCGNSGAMKIIDPQLSCGWLHCANGARFCAIFEQQRLRHGQALDTRAFDHAGKRNLVNATTSVHPI